MRLKQHHGAVLLGANPSPYAIDRARRLADTAHAREIQFGTAIFASLATGVVEVFARAPADTLITTIGVLAVSAVGNLERSIAKEDYREDISDALVQLLDMTSGNQEAE